MGAVLAVVSFVLANGLSASGTHAALHASSQAPSPRAHPTADVGAATHATDRSAPDRHAHDPSGDCACLGTCVTVTPQVAPSGEEALLPMGGVERDRRSTATTTGVPARLKAYLFPLPNAPPLLA